MSRFKAVIFDLDGVITDTAHYHYLAWKRLAESEGVHFDHAFNEQLKGIDRMGSLDLILAGSPRSYSAARKQELADLKNRHYQELIATMTQADLLPGAVDALASVREAGLRIGLASVSRNAFTVLERLGIRERFDYVVDAAQIAKSKPHPEIFLTAALQLGVAPVDCLGVEDAVAGVAAIKSAGMVALGIGDPAVLTQADLVIPGLDRFSLTGLFE
jgi:beta-phosphoglucomutase